MVEAVGVEPTSTIIPNSSHSQAWLVYYHKLAKIDSGPTYAYYPVAFHLLPGNHFWFFIFAGIYLLS